MFDYEQHQETQEPDSGSGDSCLHLHRLGGQLFLYVTLIYCLNTHTHTQGY